MMPAATEKCCPWGKCNGTGQAGGRCSRCGTPVDFPYVGIAAMNADRRPATDALLGKTFEAVLLSGEPAILRVSSIDPDRRTVVLFTVEPKRQRLVYDLDTFDRLIRDEWVESDRA